jgi:hypothetical protein
LALSNKVHFAKPNKAAAAIVLKVNFTSKDHLWDLSNKMQFSKQTKLHFKYPEKKRMSGSLERSPRGYWSHQDHDFPFAFSISEILVWLSSRQTYINQKWISY